MNHEQPQQGAVHDCASESTETSGTPWPDRVAAAREPVVLFHATTPRKLARYEATGTILPPVRGFDTEEAAREWARKSGRSVVLRVTPAGSAWPLPDHHQSEGLAWWTLAVTGWEVVDG